MPVIDPQYRQAKKKPKLKKTVKKTVNVRPPDRADDAAAARAQQLARSKPAAGDAPQTRAADTKRAESFKQTPKYVKTVQEARGPGAMRADRSMTHTLDKRTVVDRPRTDAELRKFLKTGGKTVRTPSTNQTKLGSVTAAPVLRVLDQTTRPIHAIAAAAKEDVKTVKAKGLGHYLTHGTEGRGIKAAGRGIQNKDKTLFSDVLKEAGVKNKAVRGGVGFALDVALDPTTYVTGGSGTVAKKAATSAATKAEKTALKKGLTAEQAKKFGDRAAAKAEKAGDQTKGVTVKFAGQELPGVRTATAKASKPVRAVARKVTPQKLRTNSRSVLADVNPDVAPAGVSKATSRAAVAATRTARAKSNRGLHEAQQQAVGIKAQVGEANYSRIIDAIESGTIRSLPDDLAKVAIRVRSQFRHANRLRKQAGIRGGEIKARPKVKVPEVLADSGASAKTLSKAKRGEVRAQRDLERAHADRNIHQGRAEVLSRNVSGSKAEKAAERGRRTPKPHADTVPVPAGHVRLYRGTGVVQHKKGDDWVDAPEGAVRSEGRWFTDRPERAKGYSDQGMGLPGYVTYVDVPEGIAKASHHSTTKNGETYVIPPEWARHADEVAPGSRAAAIADHRARAKRAAGADDLRYRRAVARAKVEGDPPPPKPTPRPPEAPSKILGAKTKRKSRLAPKYAGGGYGVHQTATAARDAAQRLKNAQATREAAETSHAKTVADAAVQRAERAVAEKTNAKRVAAPKGYIPHKLTEEALEEGSKKAGGVGRKTVRPSSSRARSDNRPLAALRKESPGKYSEDLPTLYADRKAEGATAVARAELNRRIADLGKPIKKGRDLTLENGESVYHVVGSDLKKIDDKKELGRLVDQGGKKGRYVVLNDDIVKRAIEGSQPTLQGPGIVRGLDKTQAGFKRIALATPGFHLRNLVGDTQNAYLGQGGQRLPGNMRRAAKVLRAEGRQDKALRTLDKLPDKGATLKTPKYGDVTYEEVARQLTKHGGMRSGFTAREIPELAGEKATAGKIRLPRKAKQALLNREDLPRLTTAVDALRKGASWEEAAQKVADYHFDYGHLTHFERQIARRAAPFYTFSARNIPLQLKTVVTKPGKYANYQKVREEGAKAAGMEEESQKARDLTDKLRAAGVKLPKGWEASLSEWEQRNAGVPVNFKGHKFTVSMGLPLADLNEFPGAALSSQLNEYYQKAMSLSSPIPKDVIEYMENHSFFFRDDIEREYSPKVAAPSWVKNLPAALKKQMGVTPDFIDKKTGKTGWGYNAKADYVVKAIPGTPAFLNKMATDGHDRVGKGKAGKVLAFVGVKATPYDPISNAVNLAYERNGEISKKMAALRQQKHPSNDQPISAKNPTPEYTRLNAQLKLTNEIAYEGRVRSGYKKLPTQGAPPKLKVSTGNRVKVPGVAARVKVPGAGGRVKVPTG